ncbi:hypothetical protein BP6252_13817 [Coleophoma cylindrospora]|uniref:Stress-response A/B barrel domain-containing protein n=1 Tax=Coleophoma cylindrospora TaxID=1849047 RepID=A0A3D8Q5T2_9HELO|nr:hypothetical protein BP6252_13817 [Coleophoma cylindrospora]
MAPILHIALYTFKSSLTATEIKESTKNMLLLKERCIHPETGKPYILSMVAGPNLVPDSPYAGGYTHALMMMFGSKADWLYYTKEDPAHTEFMRENKDWEGGCVIDIGGDEE